jgi:hypothetical protein
MEAGASRRGLPLGATADASGRLLTERYSSLTHEARVQGEIHLGVDLPPSGRRLQVRAEGGERTCSYPDSTERNFHRSWARLATGFRLGPHGVLIPRLDLWSLDIRRTSRRDQAGLGLDLTYEHPLRGWIVMQGGLELGGVRHGIPSIRASALDPGFTDTTAAPDRHDEYRYAHVGLRLLRRLLVRIEYGYRSQQSNSVDAVLGRHELRWLLSSPLPLGISAQFYGNLEHTRYRDRRLDGSEIFRPGEVEANADDNTVALQLSRPLGRGCTAEIRGAWYRNESLFLQNYYRKQVWSAGLSWEVGQLSSF